MRFEILHEFPSADLERSWREFLTRVDVPSHYDSPEYFHDPLRQGSQAFAVLAFDGNNMHGVLTGFHLEKEVISGLPSRPQICVDGPHTPPTLECLAKGLLAESRGADLVRIYTWGSLELPSFSRLGFRRTELPGSVVLDLTRGADALFKDFAKDRRRNIRFAEKHGVEVREAISSEDIRAAYEVYIAWRSTERKQVRGEWGFENFQKTVTLRGNRRLFLAWYEGRVIAINIFRFFPGGLFESAANSSLDEFMHLKPNDLLQWRGIQWACAQGLRRHSLGGAHEFLLRFGGTVVPILRYRLDQTRFRHHDLKESIHNTARSLLSRTPSPLEQVFRKWVRGGRREKPQHPDKSALSD